jgi:SAM-dependent methyltransferase
MSLEESLRRAVPKSAQGTALEWLTRVQSVTSRGKGVACPLCGRNFRRFSPFGDPIRPSRCANCRSLERHRLAWLFLEQHKDIFKAELRVLHVAPELPLRERLGALRNLDYLTADLDPSRADVQMDITAIDYPDASFDVILCSHVLEHVVDANQAMRELYRVLAPGGFALLDVPLDPDLDDTYEDWSITTEEGRRRAFWQADHVRLFGRSYPDLLRAAGFQVEVDQFRPDADDFTRYGLRSEDHIFFCTK